MFSWTSQSLRKAAAKAAYNVGVKLQKMKYFGGCFTESSVALDYIDRPSFRDDQSGSSSAG
jgi:hypothetical protein